MIRRSTWIMLVAFVAVLAGALVWNRRTETETAEPLPTPESLWSYDSAEIEGLRVEDLVSGEVVEVRRDPGTVWVLVQPEEGPADAGRVEQAVTWVRSPPVSRVLAGERDLGPFGLAEPNIRVILVLKDGNTRSFDVGAATGIAGTTYIKATGSDGIQVVSGYSLDDVLALLDDPPVVQPTLTAEPPADSVMPGTSTPGP